jgi:hypothetical protein
LKGHRGHADDDVFNRTPSRGQPVDRDRPDGLRPGLPRQHAGAVRAGSGAHRDDLDRERAFLADHPAVLAARRAAAPESGDQRKARAYQDAALGDASRITASELQAIRAFGSEVALKDVQIEVARRQFKMKQNFALTREFHKFNCVTGAVVKDSDGSTVTIGRPSSARRSRPRSTSISTMPRRPKARCARSARQVRRSILLGLKGVGIRASIVGVCGDTFWDDLTSHPEIVKTYTGWAGRRRSAQRAWQRVAIVPLRRDHLRQLSRHR